MPIPTDPAAATGLPSDTSDHVVPFLRTVTTAAPDREPPRRRRPCPVGVIDDLTEVRAMVGLLSLAAEGLPNGHSAEFCAVLEPAHARLTAILARLNAELSSHREG